jgi:hypothetical protein
MAVKKNAKITKKYECLELYRICGTDGTSTFFAEFKASIAGGRLKSVANDLYFGFYSRNL